MSGRNLIFVELKLNVVLASFWGFGIFTLPVQTKLELRITAKAKSSILSIELSCIFLKHLIFFVFVVVVFGGLFNL